MSPRGFPIIYNVYTIKFLFFAVHGYVGENGLYPGVVFSMRFQRNPGAITITYGV